MTPRFVFRFGSLALLAANGAVNALEMVGGNLCNTNDGAVLVQELVESRDATIFQGQGQISSGEDQFLVGATKNGVRRGLLAFDIQQDDFPSDAQIECTEVRLHVFQSDESPTTVPQITLHRITSDWKTSGENRVIGVNGGTVRNGDATWLYTDYPQSTWRDEGGDFADKVVATKTEFGDVHSYGNTPVMARIVQDWINLYTDKKPFNAGFMLVGEENEKGSKYVRYNGIENAPDLIPRLIVTYTSPSQGIDHRDYTGYISENVSNGTSSSRSKKMDIFAALFYFLGGMIFCGLSMGLVIVLRRKKGRNLAQPAITSGTDLQLDNAEPA